MDFGAGRTAGRESWGPGRHRTLPGFSLVCLSGIGVEVGPVCTTISSSQGVDGNGETEVRTQLIHAPPCLSLGFLALSCFGTSTSLRGNAVRTNLRLKRWCVADRRKVHTRHAKGRMFQTLPCCVNPRSSNECDGERDGTK